MNNLDIFASELSSITSMILYDQKFEVEFDDGSRLARLDALLCMSFPTGGKVELAIEVLRSAYPRDVRLAMLQLLAYKKSRSTSSSLVLCIVADRISPGSRDLLKEAGICFYDGSGSMYFKYANFLIVKELGSKEKPSRRISQLFTGAREQVVHALLIHSQRAKFQEDAYISGEELADLAKTSTYTVSHTMQELEREDWVERSGKGPYLRRRLSNASGLLDAWAAAWQRRKEKLTRWYVFVQRTDPTDKILESFEGLEGWAITGAAAANAVLPHLTSVNRVQVIVPPGASELFGAKLNIKQVDKGANVVMYERKGASLMFLDEHPERPGSRFTSKFIQYLDLLDDYGRNKELAKEYRQSVLKM